MRKCKRCEVEKELDCFYKVNDNCYRHECKKCYGVSEYNRQQVIKYTQPERWKERNRKGYLRMKTLGKVSDFLKNHDSGLYLKYTNMKTRCQNTTHSRYKYYGGKGIVVEWKSYQEFKDDMYKSYNRHLKKYGHKQTTLDRVNVNGNYCKQNCRWATWKEQNNNRTNNIQL
jgi:hypothetical protein